MNKVAKVDFGSPAERQRAKLADSLEAIAGHIRRNELEYEPHGFILLLQSEQNPAHFEALNVGIPTTLDMERAAVAIRGRIAERPVSYKKH